MTLPCRILPDPAVAESRDVERALEVERIAGRVDEPVLRPPHCALAALATSGKARGAAKPTVALDTLTRDSRRRWRLERQGRMRQLARDFGLAPA